MAVEMCESPQAISEVCGKCGENSCNVLPVLPADQNFHSPSQLRSRHYSHPVRLGGGLDTNQALQLIFRSVSLPREGMTGVLCKP